jgi:hypothetical protein
MRPPSFVGVGTAVALYPVVKGQNEGVALGLRSRASPNVTRCLWNRSGLFWRVATRFTAAESNWAGLTFGPETERDPRKLVVLLVLRLPAEQLALAVSYSESGADGRIRTGDPLFTNQTAIEFSLEFSLSMYP